MKLIKDRFKNRVEDIILGVLVPKEKKQELVEVIGRIAADFAIISLDKKVGFIVDEIMKLISPEILKQIDD